LFSRFRVRISLHDFLQNRRCLGLHARVQILPGQFQVGFGYLLRSSWRPKPSKPDNHWFDCLVGCAVAASMAGVKAPGETAAGRQRKRYTQADLMRR
jgi:hypothetical protein